MHRFIVEVSKIMWNDIMKYPVPLGWGYSK